HVANTELPDKTRDAQSTWDVLLSSVQRRCRGLGFYLRTKQEMPLSHTARFTA
ncbi:Hypothetical predicted protein, partial [Lynx pardinus]